MKTQAQYLMAMVWAICLPWLATAQGWTKTIDRHQMETITASASVSDGSILSGVYLDAGDTVYHYFISKIDTQGNVVWHHDEPTVSIATVTRVVIMSNGDITVAGNFLRYEFMGDGGIRNYVARYTPTGTKIWEKVYRYAYNISWNTDMELLPNDELLLGGTMLNNSVQPTEGEVYFHKLDSNGDSLTVVVLQDADTLNSSISKVRLGHNNTLIAVGAEEHVKKVIYINLDLALNVLWINSYDPSSYSFTINDLIATSDGGYLAVGQEIFEESGKFFHVLASKVDANGDSLWQRRYLLQRDWGRASGVLETAPGKYVLACTSAEMPNGNPNYHGFYRPFTLFLNSNGDVLRTKYYFGPTPMSTANVNTFLRLPDGGFLIGGTIGNDSDFFEPNYLYDDNAYLIRTDSLGNIYYKTIAGKLFTDDNENCTMDTLEQGLSQWVITATGADNFYTVTDSVGNYVLEVDSGTYQLSVTAASSYWNTNICPDSLTAIVAGSTDTLKRNIPLGKFLDCPELVVEIEAPLLRYCLPAPPYRVSYCNQGTAVAANAYLEVQLEPNLVLDSANAVYTNIGSNRFRFDVGSVSNNQCGSFAMYVRIDCADTLMGQAYCVEAFAFPDTVCTPPNPLWDGARLQLETECLPDSLLFRVINTGNDMGDPKSFIIIQDDVLYVNGQFNLNNGDQFVKKVPANGSTWTFITEQTNNYPGPKALVKSVERCGTNAQGNFSVGYLMQYPQSGTVGSSDVLCLVGVAAYDPNDKAGTPMGMYAEGQIEKNQTISYRIRFQNTGTDTAFMVVIQDTLSANLSPATIRNVNASHPMQWTLLPGNVLQATFYNILLPDSNINEPGSHGFLAFTIDMVDELPLRSEITNTAYIYFDVNATVVTNTTLHTIGEVLKTWLAVTELVSPKNRISFFPNPTVGELNLEIAGTVTEPVVIRVFDLSGKLIEEETLPIGNTHKLQLQLVPGAYIFDIRSGGKPLGTGKLIAY